MKKVLDRAYVTMVQRREMNGEMKSSELRKILKELGITQQNFSRELGVSHAAVSRWLSGDRKMHQVMAKHIRQVAEELLKKAS